MHGAGHGALIVDLDQVEKMLIDSTRGSRHRCGEIKTGVIFGSETSSCAKPSSSVPQVRKWLLSMLSYSA